MKYDDVTQSNKLRHSITSRGTSIPLSHWLILLLESVTSPRELNLPKY